MKSAGGGGETSKKRKWKSHKVKGGARALKKKKKFLTILSCFDSILSVCARIKLVYLSSSQIDRKSLEEKRFKKLHSLEPTGCRVKRRKRNFWRVFQCTATLRMRDFPFSFFPIINKTAFSNWLPDIGFSTRLPQPGLRRGGKFVLPCRDRTKPLFPLNFLSRKFVF